MLTHADIAAHLAPLVFGPPLPSFIDVVAPLRMRITIPIDAHSSRPFDLDVHVDLDFAGTGQGRSPLVEGSDVRLRWESSCAGEAVRVPTGGRSAGRSMRRRVHVEPKEGEPHRVEVSLLVSAVDPLMLSKLRLVIHVTGRQWGDPLEVSGFTRLIVLPSAIAKVKGAFAVVA